MIFVKVSTDRGLIPLKAEQLSKHFCVIKYSLGYGVTDFVNFRGRLALTHVPTGLRVSLVRGNKKSLTELAEKLEDIYDFSNIDASFYTKYRLCQDILASYTTN